MTTHTAPQSLTRRFRIAIAATVLALVAVLAPGVSPIGATGATAATGAGWAPGPERYDIVTTENVPITMRDGRVLRARVLAPAEPGTSTPAKGPFPVILVQTPYGKKVQDPATPYLIKRGYIFAVVDVAGTGGSQGQSQLFGEVEARDGAELVRWAAKLPNSTGKVGATGGSYLGIDQMFTAAQVGPNSPLKAIFPIATAADPFRDLFTSGGLVNMESSLGLIALYFGLRTLTPLAERTDNPLEAALLSVEHATAGIPFELQTGLDAVLQQGRVYDSPYWQSRAPQRVLPQIVKNGVAVHLVGGLFDVFQRGEPLLYSGLQNAWAGRKVTAPMLRDQPVSPRFQLMFGPWDHGNQGEGQDLDRVQLAWFDQWLKGKDTGILDTKKPMRIIEPGGASYRRAAYPSEAATTRRLHLQPGRKLAAAKPTAATGSSTIAYTGLSLGCNASLNQWGAGAIRDLYKACKPFPDTAFDKPGEVSYTTGPLAKPLRLAGPAGLALEMTSTRPDTMLSVELQDVAPDGTSLEVSGGDLLGSQRTVVKEQSWPGLPGGWILPHRAYTKESARPVAVGPAVRHDVEIRPVFHTVPAGHELRILVKTGDTPHLLPPPMLQGNLLGGIYKVQHNAATPSFLDLVVEP